MKKYIKDILCFSVLFLSVIIFVLFFLGFIIPSPYGESYQSVIIRQYDRYKTLKNNKIVLIGTSALAFGCNMDYLTDLTGMDCQILGNHAGMASPYFIEMSKCNFKSGDIVVIQFSNYHRNSLGSSLLLSGICNRYDMYRFFAPCNYKDVILDFHNYLVKKFFYYIKGGFKASGQYSSYAFDDNGNMTIERIGCEEPYPLGRDKIKLNFDFNQDYIDYLNEYTLYCKSLGVNVLITVSPVLDEFIDTNENECSLWEEKLDSLLLAPVISKKWDYIFSRKYMYGLEHCNTIGAEKRTWQLAADILPYIR